MVPLFVSAAGRCFVNVLDFVEFLDLFTEVNIMLTIHDTVAITSPYPVLLGDILHGTCFVLSLRMRGDFVRSGFPLLSPCPRAFDAVRFFRRRCPPLPQTFNRSSSRREDRISRSSSSSSAPSARGLEKTCTRLGNPALRRLVPGSQGGVRTARQL